MPQVRAWLNANRIHIHSSAVQARDKALREDRPVPLQGQSHLLLKDQIAEKFQQQSTRQQAERMWHLINKHCQPEICAQARKYDSPQTLCAEPRHQSSRMRR